MQPVLTFGLPALVCLGFEIDVFEVLRSIAISRIIRAKWYVEKLRESDKGEETAVPTDIGYLDWSLPRLDLTY